MLGAWLYLRSHSAVSNLVATGAVTLVGCALGPSSRVISTRDGALGEPLPFVLAFAGVTGMICLVDPAPDLSLTMPRSHRSTRALLAAFVLIAAAMPVVVSVGVAPDLTAATTRNVMLALTLTFLVGLLRPLLAWIPTTAYLCVSWFYGTATLDDAALPWAVPAHPPDWSTGVLWCGLAIASGVAWVLASPVGRRGVKLPPQ